MCNRNDQREHKKPQHSQDVSANPQMSQWPASQIEAQMFEMGAKRHRGKL